LEARLSKQFGKRNSNKANMVRYADDFIITACSKAIDRFTMDETR
jgi:hypothetical protein